MVDYIAYLDLSRHLCPFERDALPNELTRPVSSDGIVSRTAFPVDGVFVQSSQLSTRVACYPRLVIVDWNAQREATVIMVSK